MALRAAKLTAIRAGAHQRIKIPRIPFEGKSDGILPLIPIFAGLNTLASLVGGTGSITRHHGFQKFKWNWELGKNDSVYI